MDDLYMEKVRPARVRTVLYSGIMLRSFLCTGICEHRGALCLAHTVEHTAFGQRVLGSDVGHVAVPGASPQVCSDGL